MRSRSPQEAAVLSAPGQASHIRVRVQDGAGAWQDLANLAGQDFLVSGTLNETLDQSFAQLDFEVRREVLRLSLAGLHAESRLNLISGAYNPLLRGGRLVVLESAMLPARGAQPGAGDWHERFRGRIKHVEDSGGGGILKVTCFDLGYVLQRKFLTTEREYGSPSPGTAVETVLQQLIDDGHGDPYLVGRTYETKERVHPTARNGYWYEVTVGGVSGAEPTWPTIIGATVTSGGVTFRCMATIPTLWVDGSPLWAIRTRVVKAQPVWDAMMVFVRELGWDLRYMWRAATSQYELRLYEPARAKTTPDLTVYPDTTDSGGVPRPSYIDISALGLEEEDVRNWVRVWYYDSLDTDAAGRPKRKSVTRYDATSIDTYDLQPFIITEGASSDINTAAEAQRMADAALSDLKDPRADHVAAHPWDEFLELGDLLRYKANGIHYTADQDLAVVQLDYSFGAGKAPTVQVLTRGKPAAASVRWIELSARPGLNLPSRQVAPPQVSGLTVTQAQGGVVAKWDQPTTGQPWVEFEVHVWPTAGHTPDASSLVTVARTNYAPIPDRVPGQTQYVRVVPRDAAGNRGSPSVEIVRDAGYTTPRAMLPAAFALGFVPPNGGFEAWPNASAPPEKWLFTVLNGTGLERSTASRSGRYSLAGIHRNQGYADSEYFPAAEGQKYRFSAWYKLNGPFDGYLGGRAEIHLRWFDSTLAPNGSNSLFITSNTVGWAYTTDAFTAPANTAYAAVRIVKCDSDAGPSSFDFWADQISVTWVRPHEFWYRGAAIQTIIANTETTVLFDTQQDSHLGNYNAATGKFTCPVGHGGVYQISAALYWDSITPGSVTELRFYVNNVFDSLFTAPQTYTTAYRSQTMTYARRLNDGDFVEVRAYTYVRSRALMNTQGKSTYASFTRLSD